MRATYHSGRAGKNGAYLPQHNDRQGGLGQHIDSERSAGNRYWTRYKDAKSFNECEARFYEQHFRAALDAKNDRYTCQRHSERVQTMDEYRQNSRSCPEETIWQLGRAGEAVDPDMLWTIVVKCLSWQEKAYPQCKLLDAALHVDEQGAPHVHVRQVWIAHDKSDYEVVGQAAALREMGIERPDTSKRDGRYNCAKMTFTASVREHLQAVALEHGIELETVPKESGQVGLSLTEYQTRQEEDKARAAQEAARAAQEAARAAQEAARAAQEAVWTAQRQEAEHKATADALRGVERAARGAVSVPAIETLKVIPARRGFLGIGKRPELAIVEADTLADALDADRLTQRMRKAAATLQEATQELRAAERAHHLPDHDWLVEEARQRATDAERRARKAEEAARAAQERANVAEARASLAEAQAQAAEERAAWADPELLQAVAAYAKRERITAEVLAGIGQSRDASHHRAIETAIKRR